MRALVRQTWNLTHHLCFRCLGIKHRLYSVFWFSYNICEVCKLQVKQVFQGVAVGETSKLYTSDGSFIFAACQEDQEDAYTTRTCTRWIIFVLQQELFLSVH